MINLSSQVELNEKTQVTTSAPKNAALVVFESVLLQFLRQAEALDPEITKKLRQSVRTQVSLSLTALVERQRLNSWIMGYTDKLQVDISMDDMRHCVHQVYMTACDYFGPSQADVMLSNAIKASESLPAASEVAPRNLL